MRAVAEFVLPVHQSPFDQSPRPGGSGLQRAAEVQHFSVPTRAKQPKPPVLKAPYTCSHSVKNTEPCPAIAGTRGRTLRGPPASLTNPILSRRNAGRLEDWPK